MKIDKFRKPSEEKLSNDENIHPQLLTFWNQIGWSTYENGFFRFCDPEFLYQTLNEWLGGEAPNRFGIGFTGLGHIIYFRDLREKAQTLGMSGPDAENACDFSVIDVHFKDIEMVATSSEQMVEIFEDQEWVEEIVMKPIYDEALQRLGPPEADEIFSFVPALVLGGAEASENLQKQKALEHWSMLLQL